MQAAQAKLLEDLWQVRQPTPIIESKEAAVILASIVEKETGVGAERPVIASVFINRLKKGMRLQSDPTIIYGIVGGKGKLDRPLTRNDIETETPYNTYRINGLPPGPIANPGRAALEAVLNPAGNAISLLRRRRFGRARLCVHARRAQSKRPQVAADCRQRRCRCRRGGTRARSERNACTGSHHPNRGAGSGDTAA